MNNITEQLALAYHNIRQKCLQQQRDPAQVRLIAVSKTKPCEDILAAYQAGQRDFGENYPQELVEKADYFHASTDIRWHFIGPLQSNKTRIIAQTAHWVHSIDRLKIAERLSNQRPADLPPLKVLIQINISREQSKAGILPEDLLALAADISKLPRIQLKGLMAIPAPCTDEQVQAAVFADMQQLSRQLQQHYPDATELSMGMSDDWPIAVKYGATMIRLGTAIFGARIYDRKNEEHE